MRAGQKIPVSKCYDRICKSNSTNGYLHQLLLGSYCMYRRKMQRPCNVIPGTSYSKIKRPPIESLTTPFSQLHSSCPIFKQRCRQSGKEEEDKQKEGKKRKGTGSCSHLQYGHFDSNGSPLLSRASGRQTYVFKDRSNLISSFFYELSVTFTNDNINYPYLSVNISVSFSTNTT